MNNRNAHEALRKSIIYYLFTLIFYLSPRSGRFRPTERRLFSLRWCDRMCCERNVTKMNHYITSSVIKTLREKQGLTQAQLAQQLCVSDKTVSKWESGGSLR